MTKETGNVSDSILVNKYKKLKGNDSLIDFYISERINTINFNKLKINVLKKYKGSYTLRKKFNPKYSEATRILMTMDSCFIYKGNIVIAADKIKLINSANKFVNGRFRVKNYNIGLAEFATHKLVTLKDNFCADCVQLKFD